MTYPDPEDDCTAPPLEGLPDLRTRLALSVSEAAAAVGVSERHLRSLLREIPHTPLGGRVVIPVDLLREWLRRRSQQGSSRVDATVAAVLKEVRSGS